jgi:hypothetical protein
VQLNEDAQLRVLAGQTTYVSEAKKKKDEEVKEEMKTGDKKPSSTGGTIEKVDDKTIRHHAGKNYGGSKAEVDDDEDDKPAKKKAKKESIEPEFKSKFMKMVEAKKDEAADKKKKMAKKEKMDEGGLPMTTVNGKKVPAFAADGKGKNDLGKGKDTEADDSDEEGADKGKKGMSAAQEKYFGKKVDEAKKKSADYDYTSGPEFDSRRDEPYDEKSKPTPKGELGKAFRKKMGMPEKKTESKMMPKGKKRPVKESVENKLSFKQMVQLVQESGGQQQIDPVDKALFTWAERVAKNKLGEGMKADLYAGLVYERNGGVFEMYDVLSEDRR